MTTLKKFMTAAILAALLLSGYLLGRRACRAPMPELTVQTDTLRIRDTLLVERPVPGTRNGGMADVNTRVQQFLQEWPWRALQGRFL